MKRFVEITGLIAPLIIGALFTLSGVIAPFGNAGDRMGRSFLIAGLLASLSFAVGVHLHMRTKSSGAFGIFCGIVAGSISTFTFVNADLLAAAGYWQIMTATVFSMAACAWSFSRTSTETHDGVRSESDWSIQVIADAEADVGFPSSDATSRLTAIGQFALIEP